MTKPYAFQKLLAEAVFSNSDYCTLLKRQRRISRQLNKHEEFRIALNQEHTELCVTREQRKEIEKLRHTDFFETFGVANLVKYQEINSLKNEVLNAGYSIADTDVLYENGRKRRENNIKASSALEKLENLFYEIEYRNRSFIAQHELRIANIELWFQKAEDELLAKAKQSFKI